MVLAALLALLGAVRNVWQLCCTIFYVLISLIQMGEQLGSHHLEDNCCWSSFLWQTFCSNLAERCFAISLSLPFA